MSQPQNAGSKPRRGLLSDSVVDRVRERAAENIADIISESVTLKPSGNGSLKGLCPFHDERTPSFNVNTTTGRYHCLGGETLVKTPEGDVRLDSLAGSTATIMDGNGDWVEAPVRDFGTQRLMKVTLSRNGVKRVIHATPEHRWYVRPRWAKDKTSLVEATTQDLAPRTRIPSVWSRRKAWKSIAPSPLGVMAGFVFGDGTQVRNGSAAYFHGIKHEVAPYFERAGIEVTEQPDKVRSRTMGDQLPLSWKTRMPSLDEGLSYLLGWFAGLLAADGSVDTDGRVTISNASSDVIAYLERLCDHLGIGVMARSTQSRKGYGENVSDIHTLSFRNRSLPDSLFIRSDHQERFQASNEKRTYERTNWWVVSVEETDRVEPVYCATVPTTHSFVLADNILTGNCFGCGEDGDGIAFVQETNGGDFRWAVEYLADKYGIPIEVDQSQTDNRARLRAVIQEAKEFFSARLLETPPGHPARALLEDRGFNLQKAVDTFGCGYAPDSSTALLNHLRQKRFKDSDIIDAGLARVSEKSQKPWDFFRNRLLWPINSQMGYPVGFGARRLDPNDRLPAKFINTPETDLYKKSHVLFGLSDARKAISKEGRAIVVEGYTDVMAMHLAGVTNTIASCGTAFTADHLAILRRLVGEDGEITFALDDDPAGIKATMGVYDLAKNDVKRLTVMPPSDGKDPDEYRQAYGDAALAALVEKRTPLIGTVIQNTIKPLPLDSIEDRVVALDKVKDLFGHIRDPLMRSNYASMVADLLDFDREAVEHRLRGYGKKTADEDLSRSAQKIEQAPGSQPSLISRIERDVCASFVQSEEASREHAGEAIWALSLNESKAILTAIQGAVDSPPQGTWYSRVESKAPNEGVRRNLSMLATLPLDVPPKNLSAHVNELLDRLEDERERLDRERLTEEFTNASPERKLQILKTLEGKGA